MNEYQHTVKLDITDLLSDYDAESIVGTIDDARTIFELFVRLGIEHKSTSYPTMHKYGYDRARELCPAMNTALLQQTAKTPSFEDFKKAVVDLQKTSEKKAAKKQTA